MSDLKDVRRQWAQQQNTNLEDAGHDERVDHRSLADQAEEALAEGRQALADGDEDRAQRALDRAETLVRPAQRHMGPKVWNMEKRALEKARKLGIPYEPATDRMREALEDGCAPPMFAEAYAAGRTS